MGKTRSWLSAQKSWLHPSQGAHGDRNGVPPERMNRMYVSLRRRLSDKIEDVLEEACMSRDLDTAEELLQVLEFMQTRRPETDNPNRRSSDEALDRARVAVGRLRKVCGAHDEPVSERPTFGKSGAGVRPGE